MPSVSRGFVLLSSGIARVRFLRGSIQSLGHMLVILCRLSLLQPLDPRHGPWSTRSGRWRSMVLDACRRLNSHI
jgi:hypothetical protein